MISHSDICKRCTTKGSFFEDENIELIDVTEDGEESVKVTVRFEGKTYSIPCHYDENCDFRLEHMVLINVE